MNATPETRLWLVIVLSSTFFIAELIVGFRTHSLTLIADAFHYLNDLISFIAALVAIKLSERDDAPASLAYGWQRAQILGAFFNGVFLGALGLGIGLHSIERFVNVEVIHKPRDILIVGCAGVALNVVCIFLVHEHGHHDHESHKPHQQARLSGDLNTAHKDLQAGLEAGAAAMPEAPVAEASRTSGRDLGMNAIVLHIIGDILNNLAVIAAALIIMLLETPGRFYADPGFSFAIACMIGFSAIPLTIKSGHILLLSSPPDVHPSTVLEVLESVSGVVSVHELRIWRLNQKISVASAHIIVVPRQALSDGFKARAAAPLMPLSSRVRLYSQAVEAKESEAHEEGGQDKAASNVGSASGGVYAAEQDRLERSNEQLARVRDVFWGFGIGSVTLQIEEAGLEGCSDGGSSPIAEQV